MTVSRETLTAAELAANSAANAIVSAMFTAVRATLQDFAIVPTDGPETLELRAELYVYLKASKASMQAREEAAANALADAVILSTVAQALEPRPKLMDDTDEAGSLD